MPNVGGKEDYLRIILELSREQDKVRSIDISKKLKISKPSVSEMLKKLSSLNLIKFEPYSDIELTGKGEKLARKIQDTHETIKKFAEKIGHQQSGEEAHKLEHHVSPEFLEKLEDFVYGKRKIAEKAPSYIS